MNTNSAPLVSIIDCGVGNVGSVANMVAKAGGVPEIMLHPDKLIRASKIILCGVGAFDRGISSLTAGGWNEPLREAVLTRGVPLLGICLGMQLLCRDSEEGVLGGLSFFPATVRRIAPNDVRLRIPHVGWSDVKVSRPNSLLQEETGPRFYFTHSFQVVCDDPADMLAAAEYGGPVTAAIAKGKMYGVQFHPEKSHRHGLRLISNFLQS
jgi:glutamine amidotransferase